MCFVPAHIKSLVSVYCCYVSFAQLRNDDHDKSLCQRKPDRYEARLASPDRLVLNKCVHYYWMGQVKYLALCDLAVAWMFMAPPAPMARSSKPLCNA